MTAEQALASADNENDPSDASDLDESEWGLEKGSAMATETKIGLALIVLLVCAFGFVVYRKWDRHNNAMAGVVDTEQQSEDADEDSDKPETSSTPATDDQKSAALVSTTQSATQTNSEWDTFNAANTEPDTDDTGQFNSTTSSTGVDSQDGFGNDTTENSVAGQDVNQPGDPFFQSTDDSSSTAAAGQSAASSSATDNLFGDSSSRTNEYSDRFDDAGTTTDGTQSQVGDSRDQSPFGSQDSPSVASQSTSGLGAESTSPRPQGLFDDDDSEFGNDNPSSADNGTAQYGDTQYGGSQTFDTTEAVGATDVNSSTSTGVGQQSSRYGGFEPVDADRGSTESPSYSTQSTGTQGAARIDSSGFGTDSTTDTFRPADDSYGTQSTANDRGFESSTDRSSTGALGDAGTSSYGTQNQAGSRRVYDETTQDAFGSSATTSGTGSIPDAQVYGQQSQDNYSTPVKVYAVRAGDNYWKISKKVYGTSKYFQALARANARRIGDPNKMRPGMKVIVPQTDALEQQYPDLFRRVATSGSGGVRGPSPKLPAGMFLGSQGAPMYRVGASDSLTLISQKHLGRATRWVQIYELNRHQLKSPNDLPIGTVLRLPADASRVQVIR